jgi:peptidoglycan/LPS O-acetylase OafA/YrhL
MLAQVSRTFARFGHTAVIIFFVLSGFFVGGIVVREVEARAWSWKRYATARMVRLYVVLIPGLLLTAGWDRISSGFTAGMASNAETSHAIITPVLIAQRHGIGTFLGNIGFLQTVFVLPFGSNTALWSLANEFWYYLVFPCFWLAARGAIAPIRRACYLAAGTGMLFLVGWSISAYFAIWLMGAAICVLPQFPHRLSWAAASAGILGAVVLVATLACIGLGRTRAESVDFVVGAAFALSLYAMRHRAVPSRHGLYAAVAATLAGFSYSLYVVHLPVLMFVRARLTYRQAWVPDPKHLIFAAGIVAAVMGYAYIIAQLTEANTDSVRRWVLHRIDRVARPIPAVRMAPQALA